MISYQGQLIMDGQPLSGSEHMVFRFFDRPDGGSPLAGWEEDRTVGVHNGIFSVMLGEENPLPDELFEQNGPLFLSVTVDGVEVRLPMASAPFALRSGFADRSTRAEVADEAESLRAGTVSAEMLEDGSLTSDKLGDGIVVRSLNDLTETVELVEGSNISIETNAQDGTIEISSESGVGGLSTINTDNSLAGGGTSGSPLGIASGAAVRSLNGLADDVDLEAGDNVSIDVGDGAIRISASQPTAESGGGGVSSLNDLDGDVSITGGRQIEISVDGQEITIDRVGNGGPPSSLRYKDNIQPLVEALAIVEQLEGVTFSWKEDGRGDIGLIAEEVEEVLPQVVHYDDDERVEGVRYDSMVALLLEAIKEQQVTIVKLEGLFADQQRRIERLERHLGVEHVDDE